MKRTELKQRGGFYLNLPKELGVLQFYLCLSVVQGPVLEVRYRERAGLEFAENTWPNEEGKKDYPISKDLAAKTALCCFGLLPADLYADALQEEVPEAEWAAELLREWAKVERDNGT